MHESNEEVAKCFQSAFSYSLDFWKNILDPAVIQKFIQELKPFSAYCEFSLHKLTANLKADGIQEQASSFTVLNLTPLRSGLVAQE